MVLSRCGICERQPLRAALDSVLYYRTLVKQAIRKCFIQISTQRTGRCMFLQHSHLALFDSLYREHLSSSCSDQEGIIKGIPSAPEQGARERRTETT